MGEDDREQTRRAILLVVSRIPPGRVATYGQVALLAGLPGRARLVGHVLSRLPRSSLLPWHRVVNATGRSSLPGAAGERQRRLLARENVEMRDGRVSLSRHIWTPVPSRPV